MFSFLKPILTFLSLSASSIVPLSLYVNDGIRREQHTWSPSNCVFGDWNFKNSTSQLTLLECSKNNESGRKHKFFLLRSYTNTQNGWNTSSSKIERYSFSLIGSQGTLTPVSSNSPLLSLQMEELRELKIPMNSKYEVFVQKINTSDQNQKNEILNGIKNKLNLQ